MTSAAKRRHAGGRKTKLTPDLMAHVLRLVRTGQSPRRACIALGVSPATYARWHVDMCSPDVRGIKREFRDALATAQEEGIARLYELVRKAAETDPIMALKILERIAPNEFAPRKGVEISGPNAGPVQTQTSGAIDVRMGVLMLPPEDPEPELLGHVVPSPEPRALPEPTPSAASYIAQPRAARELPPSPEPEPVPRATHENPLASVLLKSHADDEAHDGGRGTSW